LLYDSLKQMPPSPIFQLYVNFLCAWGFQALPQATQSYGGKDNSNPITLIIQIQMLQW